MKLKHQNVGKPFVKWAGGKTQLLNDIDKIILRNCKRTSFTYLEPFLGGGAVLFHILNNYPSLKKAIVNDINSDLIGTYETIKNNVTELIKTLDIFHIRIL